MPFEDQTRERRERQSPATGHTGFSLPTISLPTGGGAIRGTGEKFAANPITGTGSITVPIATSPGRGGFGPQLTLSYDSGAGNGPFGIGWTLSLPAISRKTEKGLPQYRDAAESDVFILSSAEDLVPGLVNVNGQWLPDASTRTVDGVDFHILNYRPRIEGLFARIARWTNQGTGETHWRSITGDNVTTLYGNTASSRISDPDDPLRVFSWLISQSYDDRGNAIVYEYKPENDDNLDLSRVHERNRTTVGRSANRYPERIRYGNRSPNRDADWNATNPARLTDWMFEVVFDYGEGFCSELPLTAGQPEAEQHRFVIAHTTASASWPVRVDPFSSYRAGFDVRTYRLCRRVLMFHHFRDELGIPDYLVRSIEFSYSETPVASFIRSVAQSGYVHQPTPLHPNRYLRKSLPPLEFGYSQANIDETVRDVDRESLEHLPYGLDGSDYQWVDLDGEGISGVLTEEADGWFYKRNLSPAHRVLENGVERMSARFGAVERIASKPAASLSADQAQLLDLAGDGQLDLVQFDGPMRGFYEHTDAAGWITFRPFKHCPNLDTRDPNLRFIDLDGDGRADILVCEDEVFSSYASLGEDGFGGRGEVRKPDEEEKGPRLVFDDGTQSIYLADASGDGLTDLVRIRNGEVCYWPNLGYGRFGARVVMDGSPTFDLPDRFDRRRIRFADIDGSGTTDLFYLGADGITIWRNQSGNSWSGPTRLDSLPRTDDVSSVTVVDLLGNGTACLVWSSPLPGYAGRHMRYVDLMSSQKPHLLVSVTNNLGAETFIHYAASTTFYVDDKLAGKPWITRLPFPVHVVVRVETYDHVSRNRFVTRYAYHHGYFDGEEREFRGFGMVDQFDTEQLAALTAAGELPTGDNVAAATHVPPVHTRTWYHTGAFLGRERVSSFFAGLIDGNDRGEYYREPGLNDQQVRALLLEDTVLPEGLSTEEEREACRALKGSILRQEIYALDHAPNAEHPYRVSERNYTLRRLQPRAQNRHAVFFPHSRETIDYQYERIPADPRVSHSLTLEVDDFGNVLKSAAVGYGRRQPDLALSAVDRAKQTRTLITYSENMLTNPIALNDAYRLPLPVETRSYELTGYVPSSPAGRLQLTDFVQPVANGVRHRFDSEIPYEGQPTTGRQRRLIEQVRLYYRPDDCGAAANGPLSVLPLGQADSLALPGETYRLAFTPGLVTQVYQREQNGPPPENLIANPTDVFPADAIGGRITDRGGYVDVDGDGRWWVPSGRGFYSPDRGDTALQELAHARQHFFLPHRSHDPFGQTTTVTYDRHDLLIQEARDALDNRVTAGERGPAGITQGNDYRVLQPRLISDPNENRSAVMFDALGLVVGTAVMGKILEPDGRPKGDTLTGFVADLTQQQIDDFAAARDPHTAAGSLLGSATTRTVYDVDRFWRTRMANPADRTRWAPVFAATLGRETHASDLVAGQQARVQVSFAYSDGFGREIQRKIQAEPGPAPTRDPVTGRILIVNQQPVMTRDAVTPRWVCSGWTIYNNKGKPVRQYEPFFTDTHRSEFDVRIGVSPVLFYDPIERVIVTLHPNDTYEKVVFDPWRQETWDPNDTVLLDPRTDRDIQGFIEGYFAELAATPGVWQTWHAARVGGALGLAERDAAVKTEAHASTPTTAYYDTLGRPFLTLAHNGFGPNRAPVQHATRVHLDIEGNQREVVDARDRLVMRYDYDMLGTRVHQASMEAGARWLLNDAQGNPVRAWDGRGHAFRTEYDVLRRPMRRFVNGTDVNRSDPRTLNGEVLFERIEYGEGVTVPPATDVALNLRTRVFRQYDGAGTAANFGRDPVTDRLEAYDFKGNLLRTSRQLPQDYRALPDWSGGVPMDAALYSGSTTYDALNRPTAVRAPDDSVIRPAYNEANLLNTIDANLRGEQANGRPVWTPFVTNIDYDATGRRTRIEYGSGAAANHQGVTTLYTYDPLTFRLTRLLTRRDPLVFSGDCPQPAPAGWPGCEVQNLRYIYDPAGNITHIQDDAQQAIYFRNRRVEPSSDYTYDAIYRLIEATGREHLGQAAGGTALPPAAASYNDRPRVGALFSSSDGNAMGTYLQRYVYDEVGNFMEMIHRGSDPSNPGWTRAFAYDEPSLLEPAAQSNRLTRTTVSPNAAQPLIEGYAHDAHGNMTQMPHLQAMAWDFKDQLLVTQRQAVNADDVDGIQRQGERTYYVYDASGQRIRKVSELARGQIRDERIYLGTFEIYRRPGLNAVVRETLHILDDKQRVGFVETRTQGNEPGVPRRLIRYQFSNHLGSSSLELDEHADIVSYEEYTPYGGTSYHAVRSRTETPKRYRYTGKERDEESGFYYHGARYYAPWLGRWVSCDPQGPTSGTNLYLAVSSSPIIRVDPDGAEDEAFTTTAGTTVSLGIEYEGVPGDLPLFADDPFLLPEFVEPEDPGFLVSLISPSFRYELAKAGLIRPLHEPVVFHPGTHRQQFERGQRRTTRNLTRAINRAGAQTTFYAEVAADVVGGLGDAAEARALIRVASANQIGRTTLRSGVLRGVQEVVGAPAERTVHKTIRERLRSASVDELREAQRIAKKRVGRNIGRVSLETDVRVAIDALIEADPKRGEEFILSLARGGSKRSKGEIVKELISNIRKVERATGETVPVVSPLREAINARRAETRIGKELQRRVRREGRSRTLTSN